MNGSTRIRRLPDGWSYKTLNDRGLLKKTEKKPVLREITMRRFIQRVRWFF